MAEETQLEERRQNLSNPDSGLDSSLDSNIAQSLDQILRSTGFRGSAQLQTLLKYIVEGSISGNSETLKERIIGIDVFGRKSDYDTAEDPIVRSRVGLLRKRLTQFYDSDEARGATVQIVIPNGSYRPAFVFRPVSAPAFTEPPKAEPPKAERPGTGPEHARLSEDSPDLHQPTPAQAGLHIPSAHTAAIIQPVMTAKRPRRRLLLMTAALLSACAVFGWLWFAYFAKTELYLVWAPILESKKTVLLYTGTINPVYLPGPASGPQTQSQADLDSPALVTTLVPFEENSAPSVHGFELLRDGLVPPGDITADMKVAALMNTYGRNLSLRYGSGLPFVDLKGSPTVLIGAYDNYWTLELARDLPFFFDRAGRIHERNGQHRTWTSIARADSTIRDDYAVVFRLLDSKAGGPVIAISGLTTCGTQAAAEFMSDATQLKKLNSIPRSALEHKNLEFVLHASLENCTPTSVDVVGQQVW